MPTQPSDSLPEFGADDEVAGGRTPGPKHALGLLVPGTEDDVRLLAGPQHALDVLRVVGVVVVEEPDPLARGELEPLGALRVPPVLLVGLDEPAAEREWHLDPGVPVSLFRDEHKHLVRLPRLGPDVVPDVVETRLVRVRGDDGREGHAPTP